MSEYEALQHIVIQIAGAAIGLSSGALIITRDALSPQQRTVARAVLAVSATSIAIVVAKIV